MECSGRTCAVRLTILAVLLGSAAGAGAQQQPSLWGQFLPAVARQYGPQQGYQRELTEQFAAVGPPPPAMPAVVWKPYARGSVRVLFLLPYRKTRLPIELAARFDMAYEALPTEVFAPKSRTTDLENRVLTAVEEGRFDVAVAEDFDAESLSPAAQQRLVRLIRAGMGWVSMTPPSAESFLDPLMPAGDFKGTCVGTADTRASHFVCDGFPPSAQVTADVPRRLTGEALLRVRRGVAVAVREEEKGRCVSYAAGLPESEEAYSLLMRAILWAGRKESAIAAVSEPRGALRRPDLREMAAPGDFVNARGQARGMSVRVSSRAGQLPAGLRLSWELRDEIDGVLEKKVLPVVAGGDGAATVVVLPTVPLPAGTLRLHYRVQDGGGNVLSWGIDQAVVEGDVRFVGLDVPDAYDRGAKELTGTARFENLRSSSSAVDLTIRVLDSHRRRLPFFCEQHLALAPESAAAHAFRIPADPEFLFGNMGYLQVEARQGAAVLARRLVPFFAPRSPDVAADDWQQSAWGMPPAAAGLLRDWGFNSAGTGIWRYPDAALPLVKEGFPTHLEYICTSFGHWGLAPTDNVFPVPLVSEEYLRTTIRGETQRRAGILRKLGIIGYACSEEIGLGVNEVCFSDATQAAFRRWALAKHGGLANVNAAWGTSFASPDDVRGVLLEDWLPGHPDNPARWIDFRMFMEDVYNGALEEYCRAGKAVAPEGHFGYNAGPHGEGYAIGHNRSRLGRTIGFCVEYLHPWIGMRVMPEAPLFDILRSRNVPMLLSVIGYPSVYVNTARQYDYQTWFTALHGGRGVAYYGTLDAPLFSKLDGTLAANGATKTVRDINADLRAGLGRLLIGARRGNTGVGVYYSRASMYALAYRFADMKRTHAAAREAEEARAAEALKKDPAAGKAAVPPAADPLENMRRLEGNARAALQELATASGYAYDYVFPDQLVSGELAKGYRALLLPAVVALSAEEVRALRSFVDGGGLVVADVRTGVWDDLGRANPLRREIEDLFGIAQSPALALDRLTVPLSEGRGDVEGYGPGGARAAGGRALGSANGQDVCIVNRRGKGATLYLNFCPKKDAWLAAWEPMFVSAPLKRLFISLAEEAGARRPVVFFRGGAELDGIDDADVIPYAAGRNRYLFIQRRYAPGEPPPVEARLDGPRHVYDMRARAYLGRTDRPSLALPGVAATAAYALLDHRVTGIAVETPKTVRAGEKAAVRVKLAADGGPPTDHTVHLEVRDPSGRIEHRFTRNLSMPQAGASEVLRLTLDEIPGRWTVTARDVESGMQGDASFTVAAGGPR